MRRRGEARRAALLDAARVVFLEQGYEGAQMQEIAARAGASKETLYRYFPDKAALFGAIIRAMAVQLGAQAETPPQSFPPREALQVFGTAFLRGLLQPDAIALHRLAIAEAGRFPELGQAFHRAGPASVKVRLADYLAAQTRQGMLRCPDPEHAAALLLGALVADLQLTLLTGGRTRDPGQTEAHVAEAVALFLARYGAD